MNLLIRPSVTTYVRKLLGDQHFVPLREGYQQYRKSADLWRNPRWRASVERLKGYRDRYRGKRCFIIGNGPSLQQTDLSLLRDEFTFGMNRIYLKFDELGFATSFFVAVNRLVLEQFGDDIAALPCPKFVSTYTLDTIPFPADMMFVRPSSGPQFYSDVTRGVWEGATVTYVAMQLAYYMGFEQVILIGVDHNFETKGEPHRVVVSTGADPNHFDGRYFGPGIRWQLPDLETSELAYRIARHEFEKKGRQVLDATVGGKLEVFPKVRYEGLFR